MWDRLVFSVAIVAVLLIVISSGHGVSATDAASDPKPSQTSSDPPQHKPPKCNKIKKCPRNEEFSYCPQSIQRAQFCSEKGQPYRYSTPDKTTCKEGCVCKENYLRADNGTCICADDCPITCGPNEVVDDCPSNCKNDYCPTDEETAVCGTPDPCPPPACKCAFNHRRALNGSCIPIVDCPPFACDARPNEIYNPCPPICPSDDCSQASLTGECPSQFGRIGIVLPCNPKCRCVKDFWRLDGVCVPYGQCPGVCPANERFSSCVQGECRHLECSQKGQPVFCARIRPEYCIKQCVCIEGYLRDENGVCVLEDQCKPNTCPINEEFVNCIQGVCRAMNCEQKGQPVPCPDYPEEACDSGCICKENFLRNADDICVPEDECEANTCPINEEFVNCIQGVCRAMNCEQKGQPVPCPDYPEEACDSGCICKEKFLRNADDICVPEDECEVNVCPPNEEWSECAQAICRAQNCTQRGKPIACPMIAEGSCIKACVCQTNYLRNASGDCIPEDQCPPQITCGENEVVDNCAATCTSDNCPKCANEQEECVQSDPCQPACKCRFNYRRAENKTCIPTESCPPFDCSGKPNEKYVACPPLCPSDQCSLARVKGQCPYKIGIVLECNPKCQCEDGYGRVNGTCVPFEECPDLCPDHEEYSSCIQRTCRPQTCSDRDTLMETCSTCNDDECERGCVCQENYYRNDDGICVSYNDCSAPLCPNPHEVYTKTKRDCPPNTCRSLVIKITCDENQLEYPGCVCESGYLRTNETGPCVEICDCPEMANSPDC